MPVLQKEAKIVPEGKDSSDQEGDQSGDQTNQQQGGEGEGEGGGEGEQTEPCTSHAYDNLPREAIALLFVPPHVQL